MAGAIREESGVFQPRVPTVTIDELPTDAHLLDVREPDEWSAGRAPDAQHIPMREIPGRLDDVPAEGDVVVVCRVGSRSAQVVNFLLAQGRDNVFNLDGGMRAWADAGRPVVGDSPGSAEII